MNKPSIPKGTRDFGPEEMLKRNYIFDTIRSVYALYGFRPIETPSMENLSTLTGKYGEEGDRLLFKILNSGDFIGHLTPEQRAEMPSPKLATEITEKGLRYDLTVPFARYVVMHRNEITFPFKRYQIQPVWRADRPQKGRYREFYQCDADTIGTDSLWPEVEFVLIFDEVFRRLGIRTALHLNNRKILAGIAEAVGMPDRLIDLTIAIDKWDKVGKEGVYKELQQRQFSEEAIQRLAPILEMQGSNEDKLAHLRSALDGVEIAQKGLDELEFVFRRLQNQRLDIEVVFNPALARGLDYYTGAIFEVKALDVEIGSICGGGRYDNLTGIFGLDNVSGVGISFGAERIYDVLTQLDAFPQEGDNYRRILIANFGEEEMIGLLPLAQEMRRKGISVEIYPESAKIKKQMSYADSLHCSHVLLAGSRELEAGEVSLKNMQSGEQVTLKIDQVVDWVAAL